MRYKKFGSFLEKNHDYFYFVFRVIVGLLFFQHGAIKLYGWFGGNQVEIMSFMGVAGVIEFYGGALIILGLFTRYAALLGMIDMVGAWYIMHIPKGFMPILNGGELAALFFASFLILLVHGTKKWGLDKLIFKRHY
ncbi:MAG TPA: DoxX family protein [Candidatus Nanoarchaeia archaeon]|nr:DoxX family protein [Candidatus Nanoarchaeia archaeon]